MNKVEITSVKTEKNSIKLNFEIEGTKQFKEMFIPPFVLNIEYEAELDGLPESIAVIPFICNVLPIIWLFDAELIVNEIDKSFYESIPEFKNGYIQMYKNFEFGGRITAKSIIKNDCAGDKSAALFTAGVDAFYTMLSHIDEHPALLTLWGADVPINNEAFWKNINIQIKNIANQFNLPSYVVKTNFREFFSDTQLTKYVACKDNELNWYLDFQSGIGILGHISPLAYIMGIGKLYIASSYTTADIGRYCCASDPTIDNYLRFANTQVIHDAFECSRQLKVQRICEYSKKNNAKINIHVCNKSEDGSNCCVCEKCCRTMLSIIAENENPKDYGFEYYDENVRKKMMYNIQHKYAVNTWYCYSYIQNKFREVYTKKTCPKDLKWFYNVKIIKYTPLHTKIYRKLAHAAKAVLKKFGYTPSQEWATIYTKNEQR